MTVPCVPLTELLRRNSAMYYGKLLELRDEAEAWLSYVPQTFPHYTRHTVDHSDELVRQASYLLFRDGADEPVVPFSATEVYALCAAAYLHDAGMVCSDAEKQDLLRSEQWRDWVKANPLIEERLDRVDALRTSASQAGHFIADVQLRYVLAEYFRAQHPRRAASLVRAHEEQFGRFAFGDQQLRDTVALLCLAHGLGHTDLEDRERFPTRREIRGDSVNVRLLAILLRLSDLLDLRSARACPLLLNAASPLPVDSNAHWSYHRRIQHKDVSPDRVEIAAACETAEEHRALRDWCQWLADETQRAPRLLADSRRHASWKPPLAVMDSASASATITIRPSPLAKYVPADWRFEFDRDAVFERLIIDAYRDPLIFIRELIQNSVDATRCRLSADMERSGMPAPSSPTKVPSNVLEKYPLRISVSSTKVPNPLSGAPELRTCVRVEDVGVGMTQEVVQKYLLQVGRSYYTTEEFRRRYAFTPVSQFGVGFLSVFGASDHVEVNTRSDGGEPLRLILTGPRNYILVEHANEMPTGTHVTVTLREQVPQGKIADRVKAWCRRVEFPIVVDDHGAAEVITREQPADFVVRHLDPRTPSTCYSVRAFPFEEAGREGEFYVFAVADGVFERWAGRDWVREQLRKSHPAIEIPEPPSPLVAAQGITVGNAFDGYRGTGASIRVDYRCRLQSLPLSRDVPVDAVWQSDPVIAGVVGNVLREHLRAQQNASRQYCRYVHELADEFDDLPMWRDVPMHRVYSGGAWRLMSDDALYSQASFWVFLNAARAAEECALREVGAVAGEDPVLAGADWKHVRRATTERLVASTSCVAVRQLSRRTIALQFKARSAPEQLRVLQHLSKRDQWHARTVCACPFPSTGRIGVMVHSTRGSLVVLNERHSFIEWLADDTRTAACMRVPHGENALRQAAAGLIQAVNFGHTIPEWIAFIEQFRALPGITDDARPPIVSLDAFTAPPGPVENDDPPSRAS